MSRVTALSRRDRCGRQGNGVDRLDEQPDEGVHHLTFGLAPTVGIPGDAFVHLVGHLNVWHGGSPIHR